jgi:hypothetical protein
MAKRSDLYPWSVVKPTASAVRTARDAWTAFNAQASANQSKQLAESRCHLLAIMITLACVPADIRDACGFDLASDRSLATARFRSCVNAVGNADWVTRIHIPSVCVSRSNSSRLDNQLREAVSSVASVVGGLWSVVPDRNSGDHAFIVRVSN